MKCRSLMIQGTASHVGKSILVAAFCRILRQDGYNVAPFKAQNMALNSFITKTGGEMGRAQVVQAEAAGVEPDVDMNPVLIKPNTDVGAQVIIHGRVYENMSASLYHKFKKHASEFVRESFQRLSKKYDFIIIEGAGSPAEINLRENDIANMGMAEIADCSVVLAGDIDRGGVFASLVGTIELLSENERKRIKGFIINKFRGDISLLKPGLNFLGEKTGIPVLGTIPYFKDIYIQEEDSVSLEREIPSGGSEKVDVAVIRLPHISNFTDFDPFEREPGINLRYVNYGEKIGNAGVVIIPGSKNTIDDLNYLHNSGYVREILRHYRNGGSVVGVCGGYQMLGEYIEDPFHIETSLESINGIGLLPVRTFIEKEKVTCQVSAKIHPSNQVFKNRDELKGYEIHMGRTELQDEKYMFEIIQREEKQTSTPDGFISEDGRVWGTYIHGIFDNDCFRQEFIKRVKEAKGISVSPEAHASFSFQEFKETQYDRLAELVRNNIEMETFYRIAGLR
ncbi:MAG: adenosylcobyric acid synthase [Desulfobacteraceae bacterium Eth-SRB1]|nr:MAG: adenosylcobyric acid synthase [Desulfobacteraceae bacterium Eth-SRB1]